MKQFLALRLTEKKQHPYLRHVNNTTPKLKLTKRKHHQQLKPHPNRAPNAMRLTIHDRSSERLKKRRKIQESQEKYNQKMVDSSKEQRQKFKINDLVSIKIDKVDKSTRHPNLLMAKIVSVDSYSNYVQVVTPFGRIKGAIAPNRLNHCTATNVTFNDNKEIFSAACKEAAIS